MKKLWLIALFGLIGSTLSAQQDNWCASDQYLEDLLNESPAIRAQFEEMRERHYEAARSGDSKRSGKIIVPTVVHVLWSNCEGNISKAQVLDGMRILNEDLQRTNADSSETREVFKEYAAGSDIEFRLVKKDPFGNATDGINRIQTPLAVNAGQNVKSLTNWPADEYFNIWVVESIYYAGQSGVLGYAQFPGSGGWGTYGIVIRNDAFGTMIGTSNADGRTLPHEVGHCLDLYHTFQGGCGSGCSFSGDYLCDTPPTSNPSWTCQVTVNDCTNDSPFPFGTPPQSENYMSYNSCQNMFTEDQVAVMETVFDQHFTLEQLVSEDNVTDKGVGGLVAADFESEYNVVVENEPMRFYDMTSYDAEEWSWDFGASSFPATSTDENPEVTFIETGMLPVELTATVGNDDETVMKDVFVVSELGDYVPRLETFENMGSIPNDEWLTVDTDLDEIAWQVTASAAYEGDQSIMIENKGDCGTATDELITQSFDFTPMSSGELKFMAAYGQTSSQSIDFLRMSISEDYGKTWNLFWVRGGTSLRSVSNFVNSNWTPSDQSEWREFSINLTANYMHEGLMFRFEFVSDGGSNLYIDNFEIDGTFTGELMLVAPEDGSEGLERNVLLDWKSVGDVDEYEYQIDKVNTFDSEDLIEGSNAYIDATPINEDTEHEAMDLDPAATYYWRVRYRQGGGISDWSEVWSFTVSEDGLGLSEQALSKSISVFPNPTQDIVTIEGEDVNLSQIDILDLSGRVVASRAYIGSNRASVDVKDLSAGAYLVRIITEEGGSAMKHLVVQ